MNPHTKEVVRRWRDEGWTTLDLLKIRRKASAHTPWHSEATA